MRKTSLLILVASAWAFSAQAGSVLVENNSPHKVKVSSIGGKGFVEPGKAEKISFKNEEGGADINIWWVKNARQLCQIYTPWDRTISVTVKYGEIQCMSRK